MTLCFMIDFEMLFLCLGVVGEMTSGSRSIARGHSSGHGRSCGRGSHHSPSLVHTKDPIEEEAKGDDSIK